MSMSFKEFESIKPKIRKGVFTKVTWKSIPTLRSECADRKLEKISEGVVTLGVKYGNKKAIKERGGEVQPHAWGEWKPGYEHFIRVNKKDPSKEYLVLNPVHNPRQRVKTQYYLDGKPISKEDLIKLDIVRPSYWQDSKDDLNVFDVKLENIIKIWR